jgi:N-acetylglucosamine-6-phosphate deacetylase
MNLSEDKFEPTEIYKFILTKVEELKGYIFKMELSDKEAQEKQEEIKEALDSIVYKLNRNINELKDNSEWDKFTIAFYGETNAGKSTLIETLRILLNEKEKLKDREKYKEIDNCINSLKAEREVYDNKIKESVKKYEQALDSIMKNLKGSEIELDELRESLKNLKKSNEEFQEELNILKEMINEEKRRSIKNFILWLLKKLPEQKNLSTIKDEINKNSVKIVEVEASEKIITEKIEEINEEISTIESTKNNEINEYDEKIVLLDKKIQNANEEIIPYCDGKIIGDGRSDYTRDVTEYEIEYNSEKFCLLDLPGIEGNEELVLENINKAVKKSHAVFYISASPNPPQSGDKENSGTIEKIKQHLGDQTEVYFLYNKKIKNPKMLKDGLVNEEEEKSLKETDEILSGILDTQYSRNIPLSAYPAFLAIGNCYSRNEESKRKFLENLNAETILSFSKVEKFKNWLTESFVTNTKDKIIRANYKKVYSVIDETTIEIQEQNEILNIMREGLVRNSKNTKKNLESVLTRIENKFQTELDDSLDEFEHKLRSSIYEKIKGHIDNVEFKNSLESMYKEYNEILSSNLQTRFEGLNEEFVSEVKKTLEKHNKTREELIKTYSIRYSIKENFDFNFKFNSGIDKKKLLSSIGGIIETLIFNILNPIGLVAIGIVIFAELCSLVNSIRCIFDKEYRAGQQREKANNKIEEIKKSLKKDIEEKLPEIYQNLNDTIKEIKDSLLDENKKIDKIINTFKNAKNEFYELSLSIKNKITRGENYGDTKGI